ncbi:hypothetical protein DID77_01955 [Candidatus Marinamargulisbacteria bacterium SCGC AG-439-L15]|nr:hypothetical protein DID77_01955 [Candidatus Marinamargulisbacteria bacterium SCGC AG-439-L15]
MSDLSLNPSSQVGQQQSIIPPSILQSKLTQQFDDTLQNIMTQSAVIADQVTGTHASKKNQADKRLEETDTITQRVEDEDAPLSQVIQSLQRQLTVTHKHHPELAKSLKELADEKLRDLHNKGFYTKTLNLPD